MAISLPSELDCNSSLSSIIDGESTKLVSKQTIYSFVDGLSFMISSFGNSFQQTSDIYNLVSHSKMKEVENDMKLKEVNTSAQ